MKLKRLSLLILLPSFIFLGVSFYIPRFFIASLDILIGYFLSYAALSQEFQTRIERRRYRFSLLKMIISFIKLWNYFRPGEWMRLKRLMTPFLFSLIQVFLMGISFWYLPICVVAGWGIFEIYYEKLLKQFMIQAQRDDLETHLKFQSAGSVSATPPLPQDPEKGNEKNS